MNKFFKVYSLMMLLAFLISCNNVKTEKSKEANSPSETATLSVESTGSVENKVPKVFASYFSQMLPNYDFLIRNSLFQEYLYIENLDMVKDKIVKVEQERYTLYNGNKSWEGDGDTQVKIWNYYAFDSDGFITDEYSLFRETPEDGYEPTGSTPNIAMTETEFMCLRKTIVTTAPLSPITNSQKTETS